MSNIEDPMRALLAEYVGEILSRSVLRNSAARAGVDPKALEPSQLQPLADELDIGMRTFISSAAKRAALSKRVNKLLGKDQGAAARDNEVHHIRITEELDIVSARSMGHLLCRRVGFPALMQVKVATAVSELARNIVLYAGSGEITMTLRNSGKRGIEILAVDQGPGIADLGAVLSGAYSSRSGMGLGLRGTERLMDEFEIESTPGKGTRVWVVKYR